MPRTAIAFTILAVALFLAGGCNPDRPPSALDPLPAGAEPQIVAIEGLSRYLAYSMPSMQMTSDQPVSVVVPVRLKTNQEINVQYRFEFYDSAGRLVGAPADWAVMHLPAHGQSYISGSATDISARTWRLVIRPAR